MGYTTDFTGSFTLDRPLKPEHMAYLKAFGETRRMKRDAGKLAGRPDPVRTAAGLELGYEGEYYVGSPENFGQTKTPDILNFNEPPGNQPGLWCQWVPISETAIGWNETEKFYNYAEWMLYLIEHFFERWGYVLNGEVQWQGEEPEDQGILRLENNELTIDDGFVEGDIEEE